MDGESRTPIRVPQSVHSKTATLFCSRSGVSDARSNVWPPHLEHVEKAISLPLLAAFWGLFGHLINHAVKRIAKAGRTVLFYVNRANTSKIKWGWVREREFAKRRRDHLSRAVI